jgi:uncharacterized repeat protein (TIGR01451 family)
MRGHGRRPAVVAVAIAACVGVLAATSQAADPDVSVSATGQPSIGGVATVTAGATAIYTFTLDHPGTGTLTNTTFTSQLPAGAVFQSASPSQGSCSAAAGTVTCNLGNIPGKTLGVTVEIEFLAPASNFSVCGTSSFKEGGSDGDSSHVDTTPPACASWSIGDANDPNLRAACVDAGGSISTGSTATSLDPQNTSVTTAEGDCIVAREFVASGGPSEACGAGFKCKTQISEVLSSPCSVDEPCTITLTFDGKTFGKVKNVFKDGELVTPCTDPVKAIPDACLASKQGLSGNDTRFVVRYGIDIRLRGG